VKDSARERYVNLKKTKWDSEGKRAIGMFARLVIVYSESNRNWKDESWKSIVRPCHKTQDVRLCCIGSFFFLHPISFF
jgi:hypothetical protein